MPPASTYSRTLSIVGSRAPSANVMMRIRLRRRERIADDVKRLSLAIEGLEGGRDILALAGFPVWSTSRPKLRAAA